MKLSIAMPSHAIGPHTNVNILNACSMATDEIEVIIRDNSGNAEKQAFLANIKQNNCHIISVDECPPGENASKLLDETRGEFVFSICDDDYTNPYAIPSILKEIERIKDSPEIIGTTGIFINELGDTSYFARMNTFDTERPLDRIRSYIEGQPSIFQFSPIRRSVLKDIWSFSSTLPVFLSYHDWLMNSMMLAHGRITYINRFIYQYYNTNWISPESGLKTDTAYFVRAGIDPSAVRLQWLIAVLEGAQTFISKYKNAPLSTAERNEIVTFWVLNFRNSFQQSMRREPINAHFDNEAIKIAQKWQDRLDFNIHTLLTDITEFIALTSPGTAQRYFDFWK